jgi:hypothetical protein
MTFKTFTTLILYTLLYMRRLRVQADLLDARHTEASGELEVLKLASSGSSMGGSRGPTEDPGGRAERQLLELRERLDR